MCSETQHTWHALGGDQGNPPAWGTPDANAVYDEIVASGRYWTDDPPRGAYIAWKYGEHGHAALSYGDGKIVTTDPTGEPGGTGIEPISYPHKWGASEGKRIWTDEYNGVRFDVGPGISHGPVYLSKLHYGQKDSDSVKRLQMHLNAHSLQPPGHIMLPIVGNYGPDTDTVVRADQQQHGYGNDPVEGSSVGPQQAGHLFTGCACEIIESETPEEPEAPPVTASEDYWYSGKPSGTLVVGDSYKRLDVDKWAPRIDGPVMSMLYLNVKGEGEFRVRLIRDPDDATAYQTYYAKAGDSFLLTHVWFEMADKGRPLWWEIGCPDGGYSLEIGTRYAKFMLLASP